MKLATFHLMLLSCIALSLGAQTTYRGRCFTQTQGKYMAIENLPPGAGHVSTERNRLACVQRCLASRSLDRCSAAVYDKESDLCYQFSFVPSITATSQSALVFYPLAAEGVVVHGMECGRHECSSTSCLHDCSGQEPVCQRTVNPIAKVKRGGSSGAPVHDYRKLYFDHGMLSGVQVRYDGVLRNLNFRFGDVWSGWLSDSTEGSLDTVLFDLENDPIKTVKTRAGLWVDQLTFVTRSGAEYGPFGGGGGNSYVDHFEEDERLAYIDIRKGLYIDSLTFYTD